jgi:Ca-activated chloride channel homolog
MLNVTITPHREMLPADSAEQKLFLMLKLQPTKEAAKSRPSTAFTFIIDTSGSMDEPLAGGKTKREAVIESLQGLIRQTGLLTQNDRIAIVQFHEKASTLIGLTPATEVQQIESAINQLRNYSGGTMMGLGLSQALKLLSGKDMASRRALLFTDGDTFDEEDCRELVQEFSKNNIPITALGFGDEFNEDLLSALSDTTGGVPFHVVPHQGAGTAIAIADLPNHILEEFKSAQQEVITNLAMTVRTVKGVKLTRVARVYPSLAEFPMEPEPYPIGNAASNDETVFILEFNLESRIASRIRLAQLGLTYDVPGQNRRGELPLQNVVVEFVAGQMAVQVDQEVMGYVQQSNITQLVNDAARIAEHNPEGAQEKLEMARRMTVRLGNQDMADSLGQAQDELRKTRKLSSGTRKTVKLGSKGKTVRINTDANDLPSDEEIRRATGT